MKINLSFYNVAKASLSIAIVTGVSGFAYRITHRPLLNLSNNVGRNNLAVHQQAVKAYNEKSFEWLDDNIGKVHSNALLQLEDLVGLPDHAYLTSYILGTGMKRVESYERFSAVAEDACVISSSVGVAPVHMQIHPTYKYAAENHKNILRMYPNTLFVTSAGNERNKNKASPSAQISMHPMLDVSHLFSAGSLHADQKGNLSIPSYSNNTNSIPTLYGLGEMYVPFKRAHHEIFVKKEGTSLSAPYISRAISPILGGGCSDSEQLGIAYEAINLTKTTHINNQDGTEVNFTGDYRGGIPNPIAAKAVIDAVGIPDVPLYVYHQVSKGGIVDQRHDGIRQYTALRFPVPDKIDPRALLIQYDLPLDHDFGIALDSATEGRIQLRDKGDNIIYEEKKNSLQQTNRYQSGIMNKGMLRFAGTQFVHGNGKEQFIEFHIESNVLPNNREPYLENSFDIQIRSINPVHPLYQVYPDTMKSTLGVDVDLTQNVVVDHMRAYGGIWSQPNMDVIDAPLFDPGINGYDVQDATFYAMEAAAVAGAGFLVGLGLLCLSQRNR